ncbi:hypothetical protein [Salmonella enterica]|uniref:hypothetical protein n=1 Tax=Salmonella enterica TaxID=28901 RepID=UPI000FB3FDBC|nr:hypothetical protein [Salmonella enterica]EDL3540946.1 hypothetical protein [Salmonella enterica subsp. enterica serovar Newport]EDU8906365.1 hypothetical protein [Salmonella enterica subsp. enterica]EED3638258.1 hypothetical protein [Salmonella enterica subsp. enterica serovar Sundsvall]MJL34176.1 hypothetical protein [Salmonella enterica subsp. enterica serovar Minnesota]HAE7668555.1 hypothetical protein [Salmonella enterica subsp. enterica serovar Muenchen]
MELPKELKMYSGQPAWLPDVDVSHNAQLASQPTQPVQPVHYYAIQPVTVVQPQPQKYVFLPWIPDPEKAENSGVRSLLMERVDVINCFINRLNDAGVPWVNVNTGKDNNGVQVLPPLVADVSDKNNDKDDQLSGEGK